MSYILVFILQVCFNICKSLEIRYTYENKMGPILVIGFLLSVMMILGVYLSIGALLAGDWFMIVIYVSGSVVGKYVSYKINTRKYRNKVFNLINKEK